MKLPRYLQVALVITVGLLLWSQFSDEDPEVLTPVARRPANNTPAPVQSPMTPAATARINLFPVPEMKQKESLKTDVARPQPPAVPQTPPLPLSVMGAWWNQNQRIVIITDGKQSWPVCNRCKAEGKIWLGSTPVSGWTLTDVTQEYLQFEWQATHVRQQLMLDDLASEPK